VLVDDLNGHTLAAASTLKLEDKKLEKGGNVEAAQRVGKAIAEKVKAKGVEQVVFDRGGNAYHGRVKALAEAAREAGVKF
jgi:large subunit ribosomal protein L18